MGAIDFHTHFFPDPTRQLDFPKKDLLLALRAQAREVIRPFPRFIHHLQPMIRHLPPLATQILDQIGGAAAVPHLILESSPADLIDQMNTAGVERAVVIAHPPYAPNEFVLELSEEFPEFIAAVNLPKSDHAERDFQSYLKRGSAKILKLHPAADGRNAEDPHYLRLLAIAEEARIPTIVHTGAIQNRLFYRSPQAGHAGLYRIWFQRFPKLKFVLAHMNFHYPEVAIELCERMPNLFVDTSWQPTEAIAHAVERLGAERVLYGSDWPLVGDNLCVSLERIDRAVESKLINQADADKIRRGNAERLLAETPEAG